MRQREVKQDKGTEGQVGLTVGRRSRQGGSKERAETWSGGRSYARCSRRGPSRCDALTSCSKQQRKPVCQEQSEQRGGWSERSWPGGHTPSRWAPKALVRTSGFVLTGTRRHLSKVAIGSDFGFQRF